MIELFNFVCQHADNAPYIFFGLLLLAGLNVPISEDLLLLTAGALASRCLPDQYLNLYLWLLFGCIFSGWETYWLGRLFGPKLYEIRWFRHLITPERIAKLQLTYEKFGIFTFILGRFIPGGVRNALFITSGMGKMPFALFVKRDFVASLISSSAIYSLGYTCGQHYEWLLAQFLIYDRFILLTIAGLLLGILLYSWKKKKVPA